MVSAIDVHAPFFDKILQRFEVACLGGAEDVLVERGKTYFDRLKHLQSLTHIGTESVESVGLVGRFFFRRRHCNCYVAHIAQTRKAVCEDMYSAVAAGKPSTETTFSSLLRPDTPHFECSEQCN